MSWDRKTVSNNSYYYRNVRDPNGKPTKVYIGRGAKGEQAAQADEKKRLRRQLDKQHWLAILTRIEYAEEPLDELVRCSRLLTRAVLVAEGYYLHRGHEWRKRKRI